MNEWAPPTPGRPPLPPQSFRDPNAPAPMVGVYGVTKAFGDVVAVSDVSFDVGPGVTALLGPNGAGKSTLFRIMCGLTPPSGGEVRILGKDVFFGLNESFSYNKFVSPDQASTVAFSSIPNAQTTQLINKQESCSCSTSLSVTDFNSMTNDELLVGLTIDETNEGLKEFDDTITPRIIPFKTSDNRKGAIKIKQFVKDGTSSHIVVDIKVQKEAK